MTSALKAKTLSVAIIGAGIGAEHLQAYLQLPESFRVQVVCDLDDRKASEISSPHGIAVSANLLDVMADPSIDLIDICLPPHLHFEVAVQALKAGKHVICEKPLVSSVSEADDLLRVLAQSGKQLFPVFQYRYGPATMQLQALIDNELAGRPFAASIETHWNRGADYYSVPWRGTYASEQGGAVLCHAIHNHDLLCRFFGPVKRVSAMTATRVNPIETEDCASISFEMLNGALASSSITLGAANDTTRLRFCFENLTVESGTTPYAPAIDNWVFTAREKESQPDIDRVVSAVKCEHFGYAGFFDAIAEALSGHTANIVSATEGRQSIELVSAVYQAAKEQRTVTLPLDTNSDFYHSLHPFSGEQS